MLKYLMLSCDEATRLTEKKLDTGRLSLIAEYKLALHMKMCDACLRYARQSAAIERAFRKRLDIIAPAESDASTSAQSISPEAKSRLLESLRTRP